MILKVKIAPGRLVPDYEALDQGVLRYLGRRHDPTVGVQIPTKKGKPNPGLSGGFVATNEIIQVPHRLEYLQEIKSGALVPVDAETARLAGVVFEQIEVKNG